VHLLNRTLRAKESCVFIAGVGRYFSNAGTWTVSNMIGRTKKCQDRETRAHAFKVVLSATASKWCRIKLMSSFGNVCSMIIGTISWQRGVRLAEGEQSKAVQQARPYSQPTPHPNKPTSKPSTLRNHGGRWSEASGADRSVNPCLSGSNPAKIDLPCAKGYNPG
jgi:hypothetical protein